MSWCLSEAWGVLDRDIKKMPASSIVLTQAQSRNFGSIIAELHVLHIVSDPESVLLSIIHASVISCDPRGPTHTTRCIFLSGNSAGPLCWPGGKKNPKGAYAKDGQRARRRRDAAVIAASNICLLGRVHCLSWHHHRVEKGTR